MALWIKMMRYIVQRIPIASEVIDNVIKKMATDFFINRIHSVLLLPKKTSANKY